LTGAEAEGSEIPVAVPMERLTPEVQEAAGGAPELMEVAVGEAATATGGEEATAPPEPALEVVVCSPEIQDAEPIRSAPMTEAATSILDKKTYRGRGEDELVKGPAHRGHPTLQGVARCDLLVVVRVSVKPDGSRP
jgi:hypothetical protein